MGVFLLLSFYQLLKIASTSMTGQQISWNGGRNMMPMNPGFDGRPSVYMREVNFENGKVVGQPVEQRYVLDLNNMDDQVTYKNLSPFSSCFSCSEEQPNQSRRVEVPITGGRYRTGSMRPEENSPQKTTSIIDRIMPNRGKSKSSLRSTEDNIHDDFQREFNNMSERLLSRQPSGFTMLQPSLADEKPKSKSRFSVDGIKDLCKGFNLFGGFGSKNVGIAKVAIKVHNAYRKLHSAPSLVYDNKIAAFAKNYADELAARNAFEHNPKARGLYGENLSHYGGYYYMQRSDAELVADAINAWYNERTQYRGAITTGTGHFTQLVWVSSKRIGVGVTRSGCDIYVVANYYPPGNVIGMEGSNVFP